MRKAIMIMLAAVSLLCSCSQTDTDDIRATSGSLCVVFGTSATRAFFDGDPQGEPWEREIKSLSVLLCDEDGEPGRSWEPTRQEIADGRFSFPALEMRDGTAYRIYIVANAEIPPYSDADMVLSMSKDESDYNGSFENVTQGPVRTDGFVMSAHGQVTTANGAGNPLRLELERTVSKVELKVSIPEVVSPDYPDGELVITAAEVCNTAQAGWLFRGGGGVSPAIGFTSLMQEPFEEQAGREYRSRFYLFGNSAPDTDLPLFVLTGRFYHYGRQADPETYKDCTFTVSPGYEGTDIFDRNIYYRVIARIESLQGTIEPPVTTYKVTYDPYGGTGTKQELNVNAGEHMLLYPENLGFYATWGIFYGWNVNGTLSMPGEVITVDSDIHVYAEWYEPLIEYNYYPNGADGARYTEYFMGSAISYRILAPGEVYFHRQGYEFLYWQGDDGKIYFPGDQIPWCSCMNFYAVWQKIIEVAYHPNGGEGRPYSYFYTGIYEIDLFGQGNFSKAGYVFDGWNTLADGTGTAYSANQRVTIYDDLTLYAMWK